MTAGVGVHPKTSPTVRAFSTMTLGFNCRSGLSMSRSWSMPNCRLSFWLVPRVQRGRAWVRPSRRRRGAVRPPQLSPARIAFCVRGRVRTVKSLPVPNPSDPLAPPSRLAATIPTNTAENGAGSEIRAVNGVRSQVCLSTSGEARKRARPGPMLQIHVGSPTWAVGPNPQDRVRPPMGHTAAVKRTKTGICTLQLNPCMGIGHYASRPCSTEAPLPPLPRPP